MPSNIGCSFISIPFGWIAPGGPRNTPPGESRLPASGSGGTPAIARSESARHLLRLFRPAKPPAHGGAQTARAEQRTPTITLHLPGNSNLLEDMLSALESKPHPASADPAPPSQPQTQEKPGPAPKTGAHPSIQPTAAALGHKQGRELNRIRNDLQPISADIASWLESPVPLSRTLSDKRGRIRELLGTLDALGAIRSQPDDSSFYPMAEITLLARKLPEATVCRASNPATGQEAGVTFREFMILPRDRWDAISASTSPHAIDNGLKTLFKGIQTLSQSLSAHLADRPEKGRDLGMAPAPAPEISMHAHIDALLKCLAAHGIDSMPAGRTGTGSLQGKMLDITMKLKALATFNRKDRPLSEKEWQVADAARNLLYLEIVPAASDKAPLTALELPLYYGAYLSRRAQQFPETKKNLRNFFSELKKFGKFLSGQAVLYNPAAAEALITEIRKVRSASMKLDFGYPVQPPRMAAPEQPRKTQSERDYDLALRNRLDQVIRATDTPIALLPPERVREIAESISQDRTRLESLQRDRRIAKASANETFAKATRAVNEAMASRCAYGEIKRQAESIPQDPARLQSLQRHCRRAKASADKSFAEALQAIKEAMASRHAFDEIEAQLEQILDCLS